MQKLGCKSADVFLTSYGVCRSDVGKLAVAKAFSGMILDEAQQIKNYNSQVSKAVKEIAEAVGPIRVALSGTPVENKLQDLNSQFEYILPGYLASSRTDFQQQFGRPVTAAARGQQSEEHLAKQRLLQRTVRPFIMRRQKTDPEICKDLPDKIVQDPKADGACKQFFRARLIDVGSLKKDPRRACACAGSRLRADGSAKEALPGGTGGV